MRYVLAIAALGLGVLARPASALPTLSLDGAYDSERERETKLLARGYNAGLAFGLGQYFSLGGHFSRLQTEPYDDPTTSTNGRLQYDTISGDLGFGFPLSDTTDLSGSGGYVKSTTTGLEGFSNRPEDSIKGPTGSLTLTTRLAPHFEFFMGPAYSYLGHRRGWDGSAGLGLEVSHGLWITGSYWGGQTRDGWTAGLSMNFSD